MKPVRAWAVVSSEGARAERVTSTAAVRIQALEGLWMTGLGCEQTVVCSLSSEVTDHHVGCVLLLRVGCAPDYSANDSCRWRRLSSRHTLSALDICLGCLWARPRGSWPPWRLDVVGTSSPMLVQSTSPCPGQSVLLWMVAFSSWDQLVTCTLLHWDCGTLLHPPGTPLMDRAGVSAHALLLQPCLADSELMHEIP